ncbi:MAG: PilZ domain-containing protein [Candidatus Eremiobacteraeota bacterium]|nr:PilZ domain-containing protein [Candidatus Eremiobacteraeota bacterium]
MLTSSSRPDLSIGSGNRRKFFRQSIELPIAISVGGLPAPVYGTLINISETGCRLRSLILVDRDRCVEFEMKRPMHPAFQLNGRVIARSTPSRGGGYEYGINFSSMLPGEREKLAREIRAMERRDAKARAEDDYYRAPRPAPESKQRRASVRTFAPFPVRYRIARRPPAQASGNEISTGGLRLMARESIATGTLLELRFTLPSDCLHAYPPKKERTEISPFGMRTIRIPDNRRPFEEMKLQGRIVARFVHMRERSVYGLAFTDIDGYDREEIARFTHAVQLVKLRTETRM